MSFIGRRDSPPGTIPGWPGDGCLFALPGVVAVLLGVLFGPRAGCL